MLLSPNAASEETSGPMQELPPLPVTRPISAAVGWLAIVGINVMNPSEYRQYNYHKFEVLTMINVLHVIINA